VLVQSAKFLQLGDPGRDVRDPLTVDQRACICTGPRPTGNCFEAEGRFLG
jgi:hypothetical protein